MNTEYVPCRERTFPLHLAPEFARFFGTYLRRLQHLLERLGRKATLAVWQRAFREGEDALLAEILSSEWTPVADDECDYVDRETIPNEQDERHHQQDQRDGHRRDSPEPTSPRVPPVSCAPPGVRSPFGVRKPTRRRRRHALRPGDQKTGGVRIGGRVPPANTVPVVSPPLCQTGGQFSGQRVLIGRRS